MSWLCDKTKKIASLFHHIFITIWQNKILWSSLALKDSYMTILFNRWSQSDKNVMRMWWLQISTYFLVHIIWKFPPLQNLMSDARCLYVDACLSAPIGVRIFALKGTTCHMHLWVGTCCHPFHQVRKRARHVHVCVWQMIFNTISWTRT